MSSIGPIDGSNSCRIEKKSPFGLVADFELHVNYDLWNNNRVRQLNLFKLCVYEHRRKGRGGGGSDIHGHTRSHQILFAQDWSIVSSDVGNCIFRLQIFKMFWGPSALGGEPPDPQWLCSQYPILSIFLYPGQEGWGATASHSYEYAVRSPLLKAVFAKLKYF